MTIETLMVIAGKQREYRVLDLAGERRLAVLSENGDGSFEVLAEFPYTTERAAVERRAPRFVAMSGFRGAPAP